MKQIKISNSQDNIFIYSNAIMLKHIVYSSHQWQNNGLPSLKGVLLSRHLDFIKGINKKYCRFTHH